MHHNVSAPALVPTQLTYSCPHRVFHSSPDPPWHVSTNFAHPFCVPGALSIHGYRIELKARPQGRFNLLVCRSSKCLWLAADNPTATQASAPLCSYIEIQDDNDDDDNDNELPPIPDDWATCLDHSNLATALTTTVVATSSDSEGDVYVDATDGTSSMVLISNPPSPAETRTPPSPLPRTTSPTSSTIQSALSLLVSLLHHAFDRLFKSRQPKARQSATAASPLEKDRTQASLQHGQRHRDRPPCYPPSGFPIQC